MFGRYVNNVCAITYSKGKVMLCLYDETRIAEPYYDYNSVG